MEALRGEAKAPTEDVHSALAVVETQEPEGPTAKTATNTEADKLGLVASWAREFGYVSLRDPTTGEWCDVQVREAPSWALWEARKRKELYKDGNRRAYRLTSRQMEEIWRSEQSEDEGIVEEHPIEGED